MEEENKSNIDRFFGRSKKDLKGKGEEESKKNKKRTKKIFIVATPVVTIMITIAIVFSIIIAFVLLGAFLEIIGDEKGKNASNAKAAAVQFDINTGNNEGNSNYNTAAKVIISFNADKGIYEVSNKYTEEELKEKKSEIQKYGIDTSKFSEYELGLICGLIDGGLDISRYTEAELKCLPLFIKAEACTSYLDLRSNDEKFDSQDNYIPKSFKDLKENQIAGTVLVQRTNTNPDTNEGKPIPLDYMKKYDFDSMVSAGDFDAIKHFTIDEKNNLIVAKWEYQITEVEGEDPVESYTITTEKIPYNESVKKFTLPYDFLVQLMIIGDNPSFSTELANLALNSKIIINIQEEETITITEDTKTYDIHSKTEKYIDYNVNSNLEQNPLEENSNYLLANATDDKGKDCTTYSVQTLPKVKVKQTNTSHSYKSAIIEADTWIVHYVEEYKSPQIQATKKAPQENNISGEYTYSGESKIDDIDNDTDISIFVKEKVKEFSDARKSNQQSVNQEYLNQLTLDALREKAKEYEKSVDFTANNLQDWKNDMEGLEKTYSSAKNTPGASEVERYLKTKYKEYIPKLLEAVKETINCEISKGIIKEYSKIDEKHLIIIEETKYLSDSNPKVKNYVYGKDEDGKYEKFLEIYDKYPSVRNNINSASSWLFSMMTGNANTEKLVSPVKTLLHEYDGKDYGVTDLDDVSNYFKPDNIASVNNYGQMIVKTDEPGALPALTEEQIRNLIDVRYGSDSDRGKNLLSAMEGFMYIQNEYKVNALFAIAIVEDESGCGTGWDYIDSSTYNWASMQGSYNGQSYTDRKGTKWDKYQSFDEATRVLGKWIAQGGPYFSAGKYSIADIATSYCNNGIWGPAMEKTVKKMYEQVGVSINTGAPNSLNIANGTDFTGGLNLYKDDGSVDEDAIDSLNSFLTGTILGTSIHDHTWCDIGHTKEGCPHNNINPNYQKWWKDDKLKFQCTWWALGRANQYLETVYAPNHGGENSKWIGESYNYAKDLYAIGQKHYVCDQTPTPNSLAVWESEGAGHIAYVEAVYSNDVYISHAAGNKYSVGDKWNGIWKRDTTKEHEEDVYKGMKHLYNGYTLLGYIHLDQPKPQ